VSRCSGRYFDRELFGAGAFAQSAVDPMTGNVNLLTLGFSSDKDGTAFDVYYNKPFEFAGLDHNFLLGADYRQSEDESIFRVGQTLTQNVFDPVHSLPGPSLNFEFPLNPTETEQTGVYTQVRLGLPRSLKLMLGGRLSWWDTESTDPGSGQVITENSVDDEFTPYAALLWQGLQNHTLYASIAEIFEPQDNVTIQNEPLPPRTGRQYEIGVKGQYFDGALVSHLAAYIIEDKNRAISDPDSPPGLGAALAAGEVESEGFEIEISGEVIPNLVLTAGYAYVRTQFERAPSDQEGETFSTITPKHNFNLWTKYWVSQGPLRNWDVGLGIRSVSSFYSERGSVRLEADGYTTVQARLGYAFTENLSLSLICNNLFDEKYYEKVEAAARQNYYGAPRNVSLILRANL